MSREDISLLTTGKWQLILPLLGIDSEYLVNRHGPCPVCGGTKPFRFDDKDGRGTFICTHHGAGDGFKLVMDVNGWDFITAAHNIREVLGKNEAIVKAMPALREKSRLPPEQAKAKMRKLWVESQPVRLGDPVATYLANRGILLKEFPGALRTIKRLPYFKNKKLFGTFQGMLALVHSPKREAVGLHRTYIDRGRKARVEYVKKLMPPLCDLAGSAVRLYKPGSLLAVAEGIETALAVHLMTGFPVWATISAPMMPTLVVPSWVKEVHIFADRDEKEAGQKAASALMTRLLTEGKKVKLELPDCVGEDFLDVYLKSARAVA